MAALPAPHTLLRLLLVLFLWFSSPLVLSAQPYQDSAADLGPRKGSGLYTSIGLGFIDLERGTGINIPVGFTAVLPSLRLIATANLLDIGLLQKQNNTLTRRYERLIDRQGRSFCLDTERNVFVSDFRCNGGTDFLYSMGVDISFVPVETQFFGGRMGKVFGGLGFRFLRPQTVYATLGILYDRPGGTGSVKVAVGKDYVFAGVVWGIDLKRIFGRF